MADSPFIAYTDRMKLIERWSLMRNTRRENVAEHSLETAIIAHMLAVIDKVKFGGKADPEKAAAAALYHDASEVFTGDLPTPIKYKNKILTAEYKKIEANAEELLLETLPEELQEYYRDCLLSGCTDPEISRIVKDADTISAYIKCITETASGNRDFLSAERKIRDTLRKRSRPALDYFLDTFIGSFERDLDNLMSDDGQKD